MTGLAANPPAISGSGHRPDRPVRAAYWLEQAITATEHSCPPFAGRRHADVCVVGGGFTGLWTAIELKTLVPSLDVVMLEAAACGFGASGRNGGWVTSWYDELDRLIDHFGAEQGLWLARASSQAIDRIEAFIGEHDISCHFRRRGSLWVSTTEAQDMVIEGPLAPIKDLPESDFLRKVDGNKVREITGSEVARSGVAISDGAAIQPALLARGLRRVALKLGIKIYEGSPMIELERTSPAVVQTSAGEVVADQVVLAMNAWSTRIRELRRAIFIVGTQMVLTEPIADRLPATEWREGLLFGDARMFVHYSQVTVDGRIVFGRGGGAFGPFGRVLPRHFIDHTTTAIVAQDFRDWFPALRDVKLTHAWGGPIDRAPGHLPFVGTLGDHANVHYGVGYSGNGVGPSNLIGRILARRALQIDDEYTRCALVGGPPGYLPPEPLASAGAAVVSALVQRSETREQNGHPVSLAGRSAKRLAMFSIPSSRRK